MMSNLEYDMISVIYHKAKAMKALDHYVKDAESCGSQCCAEIFKKYRDSAQNEANEMKKHLKECLAKQSCPSSSQPTEAKQKM
jgi:hypothetical protein